MEEKQRSGSSNNTVGLVLCSGGGAVQCSASGRPSKSSSTDD